MKRYTDAEEEEILQLIMHENKIIAKNMMNGLIRCMILWRLKQGKLHGYGLKKVIDNFFKKQIEKGVVKELNTSKIYPILQQMENNDIIVSTEGLHKNKKVKYYELTRKGELILEVMKDKIKLISEEKIWNKFLNDLLGLDKKSDLK
ncbi:MAG: PadR family transcriptional regulator [Methanobacteriaceae archaeon]|nr:PadR family transcriptional regulator [Methanobacteriaceae archaeon]